MIEFESLMAFILPVFLIPVLILWVWALVDIIKRRKQNSEPVGLWILIVLMFPIVGSILYFQLARRRMFGTKKGFSPDFKR